VLDSLDQRVEAGAPGFDARLEERLTLGAFLPKSRRETVVLREVEVDDREGPGASPSLSAALSSTKRRGLQETRGDVTRLRQQEEADLGDMRPGRDVDEVVGGAGSTTLVFQTILFPLMLGAKEPSVVTFEGGTHNPMAPPVPFLERAFLPVLDRMGGRVDVTFERYGFYPAGGGRWTATIYPAATLERLELLHRGEVRARSATALVAQIPPAVAVREIDTLSTALGWDRAWSRPHMIENSHGPGNALLATVESQHVTEVFTGFGERGVPKSSPKHWRGRSSITSPRMFPSDSTSPTSSSFPWRSAAADRSAR